MRSRWLLPGCTGVHPLYIHSISPLEPLDIPSISPLWWGLVGTGGDWWGGTSRVHPARVQEPS